MKKFLKGFGVFFFSFGIVVYTFMFFTESPELRPVFIIMDVVFAFILFLLLRKKKPKQKAPKKSVPTNIPSRVVEPPSPRYKQKKTPCNFSPADNFFMENSAFLCEMEHQIITPRIQDYGDVDSYRLAYEISLGHLHSLKEFCYKTPEGKQWFEEHYCHCFNSRCDDFSLEDQIEEGYRDLIDNWIVYEQKFIAKQRATDFLIENGPHIRRQIVEIIKAEPGILQKDIYSKFDPSYRETIISIIGAMNREKVLFREPYKNTFRLYLSPPALRAESFNIQD